MTSVPSLVAFGAVSPWPNTEQFQQLRGALREDPLFEPIISAILGLEDVWDSLLARDAALNLVPGKDAAQTLTGLVSDDDASPSNETGNISTLPFTVISQVVQYCGYLDRNGHEGGHEAVLSAVKRGGGIQGLCTGLLSAIAVASGRSKGQVVEIAATSIRLAFCIGAYVDLDQARDGGSSPDSALAVRWKAPTTFEYIQRVLVNHPNTYVSVRRDKRDVTITTPAKTVPILQQDLSRNGALILDIGLAGRYHSNVCPGVPSKIWEVCSESIHPNFGNQDLVKSNSDGFLIQRRHAALSVLESILVHRAEWYRTISSSASTLHSIPGLPFILAIGQDAVPQSITKSFPVIKLKEISNKPTITSILKTSLRPDTYPEDAIAVIGMSGKFPGADSIESFWTLLSEGRSMLAQVPKERFDIGNLPRAPHGLKFWGNFLDDIDAFDHKFFKKSSRESASMDPQQRLLLETVYQALESSGYFSDPTKPRDIGCYIGSCSTDYDANIGCHPATAYATTGTLRAFLSGRLSHYFGWSGPSMVFDTACSSSAVAIHTACTALQRGECKQAVAGGVTLITSPYLYENLATAHFLSPTGATKPFDAKADGYCRGEGVGIVVLKRLGDAVTDGDNVLGVIAGSAVNQNANCVSITVPHSESQSHLYARVANQAGITPDTISFVEAHGTGTPVGDPIEMESIRQIFGGPKRAKDLIVSSVKGNIGHLEGSSGVAAVIKALLQMQYRTACVQASFKSLNPKIPDLATDKILVPTCNQKLSDELLTACVNNYGAAGSNAAIILIEAPLKQNQERSTEDQEQGAPLSRYPIQISAATEQSLLAYCRALEGFLASRPDAPQDKAFVDIAFSLARQQNQELPQTLTASCSSIAELRDSLEKHVNGQEPPQLRQKEKPLILCFGGQVGQQVALSSRLWKHNALFRHHLDLCDQILRSLDYPGLYPAIFQTDPIEDVVVLQSALFSTQYACAKSWMDSGLRVDGLVGHSLGQLTALCVSGILSLRDGLRLVAGRAELMKDHWGTEPGTMIAVEADRSTVDDLIETVAAVHQDSYLEIACHNGPTSHVIVSDVATSDRLEAELVRRSTRYKRLEVSHGFHSRFTDPMIGPLIQLASSLEISEPKIPLETCTETQSWPNATPQLIAAHTRDPVFFGQAVQRIQNRLGQCTFLEAGSDSSITSMMRRALGQSNSLKHSFVPMGLKKAESLENLVDTTVQLWNQGHRVQLWNFHRLQAAEYNVIRLPSYQFEKHRHWMSLEAIQPTQPAAAATSVPMQPTLPPTLISLRSNIGDDGQGMIFDINPNSEEYRDLVKGHVTLGFAELPMSAYVELALRAWKISQKQYVAADTSIRNLKLHTPLGLAGGKKVELSVSRLGQEWAFQVTSKTSDIPNAQVCHASGTFLPCHEVSHVTEFQRFERLIGPEKFDTIPEDVEGTSVKGPAVYKFFSELTKYAEYYRNVKSISSSSMHVLGRVQSTKLLPASFKDSLSMPHLMDNFMQVASFYCNFIWEQRTEDDTFRLSAIDNIQVRPETFAVSCQSWDVLSFASPQNEGMSCDTFVYDTTTKDLLLVFLGMAYTRTPRFSLAHVLSLADSGTATQSPTIPAMESGPPTGIKIMPSSTVEATEAVEAERKPRQEFPPPPSASAQVPAKQQRLSIFEEVSNIFEKIADVPKKDFKGNASVEDLGVDSLMMMEIIAELESSFKLELPLEELLELTDVDSLVDYLNGKLHGDNALPVDDQTSSSSGSDSRAGSASTLTETPIESPPGSVSSVDLPGLANSEPAAGRLRHSKDMTLLVAQEVFESVRFLIEDEYEATGFTGFWKNVYPDQAILVEAYIIETFRALGCNLTSLADGQELPPLQRVLPRHSHLVNQMHKILVEGGLLERREGDVLVRTAKELASRSSAATLLGKMLGDHPQHTAEMKLLDISASKLTDTLTGKLDPLQLLFANKANREVMAEVYAKCPMCLATTRLLADFISKSLLMASKNRETFRLIEVGAGTGGTAKYLVDYLAKQGIRFEYTFTDISSALVSQAKRAFSGNEMMRFMTLDCDETPPAELCHQFDVVIATNCMHATHNATASAKNVAQLLRKDGVFALCEFTRGIYWFDLVYGLLEGWWKFSDGRQHALADQWFWDDTLRKAGFQHVSWTDGNSQEAQTMRVICGFLSDAVNDALVPLPRSVTKRAGIFSETFMWKKAGNVELQADVYFPKEPDSPTMERPVALMIHGGGHLLFGRRDIPMKHVRRLLKLGFLPVSVDYRLCPEMSLYDGPVTDCCDALQWVQETLPTIRLGGPRVRIKQGAVLALGWSSGGQLAMTLGYTARARGIPPPDIILPFYSPSDLEASFWNEPIYPDAAEEPPQEIWGVLDCVEREPILDYSPTSNKAAAGLSLTINDDRARLILHMNWTAQSVPVLIRGLPHRDDVEPGDTTDWRKLPAPPVDKVRQCSPYWHILQGTYTTPTFMVHGNIDDWIPYQMTEKTIQTLKERGVPCGIVIPDQCGHAFDLFPREDRLGLGWNAIEAAYDFACEQLQMKVV